MLLLILILLVTENVYLVQNEKVELQDSIDSTNFKNALAKELLKKKLLNLESARQQDSLAQFLRKGEKNPAKGKPNFSVDDDPSRKQAQMANSFIASSNLLFGTKSQRRPCNTANKSATKEAVLDMQYLRHSFSGFNEEGVDFPSSRDASTPAIRKRSSKKVQDPISCYLTEPRKITCMHKDIIYKIQLPSSDVADDEIGRIVESIYRAVEGNRAAIGKSIMVEDTYKTKRASDDYLKSLFLNNLLAANHPKTAIMPAYNGNNAFYLPLIIPVSQPKIDAGKIPLSYYPGLLIDPKLQHSYNMSISGGVDALNGISALGRNILVDNGYGNQYILPASYFMPANVRQRSENNATADEERRRNWLALMATNGYNSIQPHVVEGVQSLSDDKLALGSNNKLTIAETGEYLDKQLLNQRQERDTYYLRQYYHVSSKMFNQLPTKVPSASTMSTALPNQVSTTLPANMSARMPKTMSTRMSKTMSTRMSKTMSTRMSKTVPYRMSETIPSRMPVSLYLPNTMPKPLPTPMP
ncbi:hypothetical protein GE061_015203 [Apolygus lucorum]|uniref:Uncharacterized protein n=1 Tax=Apolygus lucorum TaxID=248454 RepID=A0A8S9XN49_APOLU|nr:hypothetical protein GE061_015203 [Apolygus lucorum]